jgi:hypothetical protein
MANELLALAREQPPAAPDEIDYPLIHAALSESTRGRAFLTEFARRNRHADTELLLGALDRLETRLRADGSAAGRLRDDLRMLLIAIRHVRPEINAASPAAQAVKLAALLDLAERRIEAMAEGKPAGTATGDVAEADTTRLAAVPRPDEPELPIPSPGSMELPAISLVAEAAMMPEANALDGARPPVTFDNSAEPDARPVLPPHDPLAAIMALSEDERLALFS